jgi:hypothetical protein
MGASHPRWRSAGRPPLPQFTLTEPKTVAGWPPGQREKFIAVLADIILNEYYRQWRADRGLPEKPPHPAGTACDPPQGEDAGQNPES